MLQQVGQAILELVLQCPRENKQSIYAATWGYSSRKEDYRARVMGCKTARGEAEMPSDTRVPIHRGLCREATK